MSAISSSFSCPPQQSGDSFLNISATDVKKDATSDDIQPQTLPVAIVPYVEPIRTRIRTWPNLHSLFTLAGLINNVACLIFLHPTLIGTNIAVRFGSIAFASYRVGCAPSMFASYPVNKAKISTDMISIVSRCATFLKIYHKKRT